MILDFNPNPIYRQPLIFSLKLKRLILYSLRKYNIFIFSPCLIP
nr:MAG TPA: hypothetical protein [Caudoviricetes sp.]